MFIEKYVGSLTSSDLTDDELHRATEALAAAALADLSGGSGSVLGSMLARAKFASGARKAFDSGAAELAIVLRAWKLAVAKRGRERCWFPTPRTEWDANAVFKRLDQIAEQSLAHWIDGHCEVCLGSAVGPTGHSCKTCGGTGLASVVGDNMVADRTRDMISELEGIYQSHCARAAAKMRRAA